MVELELVDFPDEKDMEYSKVRPGDTIDIPVEELLERAKER